ncbi:MAG: YfhO family protein [Chloroflexi bacterium]|nr:YfhO family protein [Chloroflexota bacterium]
MLSVLFALYLLLLLWLGWRRRAWLKDGLAVGLLGGLTLAFFWRVVSGDVYMPADGGDLASFLFPTYAFIQRSLKAGVWPLWNPHLYSGAPFVAEIQSGILYPPHLLRFLLGPELRYVDMERLAMLHIWWAGATTYLLARGLKLWRGPALLAAVAFMFSDLFIIHFGNLNLIAVTAWLPLVLLAAHKTLEGRGLRWALAAGVALGVGSLAGHIQMTLFSLMALALWVGFWLLVNRERVRTRWSRALMALVIPAAIALGVLAPVLLPGFEIADMTARGEWRYAQTVGFSLSPAQLIGLIMPNFFGRGPALHWGLWPRVEMGYVGILTLLLAFFGVLMRRDRLTWLLLGLAAVSLAFSLGVYSPVHGWFTWLLPGLEQLRAPARFIFLFDLALALLAARGLQALMTSWRDEDRRVFAGGWRFLRHLLLLALAVGVPVTYAVLLLTQTAEPTLHLRASVATIAVMQFLLLFAAGMALLFARARGWIRSDALAALAILLLFIDLAMLGAYEDISESDPTANFYRQPLLSFLKNDSDLYRLDARTEIQAFWQPSAAEVHGLDDVSGVANPLTLAYYEDFLQATGSRSSDLYALLNVKYVLARKDVVLDWDVWEPAFEGDPDLNLYRNRRFHPRVMLVGRARIAPDLAAAQQAIRAADFEPLAEVVLEGGEGQNAAGGEAQIISWGVNDVTVRTDAANPATLVVLQTWYPGWEASIDRGEWRPVLRANGVWQAVQVPAGSHEVRLRFRPRPFFLGLLIAAVTWMAVIALWFGASSHALRLKSVTAGRAERPPA